MSEFKNEVRCFPDMNRARVSLTQICGNAAPTKVPAKVPGPTPSHTDGVNR